MKVNAYPKISMEIESQRQCDRISIAAIFCMIFSFGLFLFYNLSSPNNANLLIFDIYI